MDLEKLDQLALEFWQDDLAKFFVKQKEPTYSEYRMFQAGFQKAQEKQMSYVEVCQKHGQYHGELCGECFEEIKKENARLREALETLLDRSHEQHCDWLDPVGQCNCWLSKARAALEDK